MLFFFALVVYGVGFGGFVISFIEGTILFVDAGYAVVVTHGVGYHVLLSKRDLDLVQEGQSAQFFVHTHVREDAFELFGFSSRLYKQIFLLLTSVSGVGPKLALGILSALDPRALLDAIITKDIARLSSIHGIGKKTAERIALELKEKAQKLEWEPHLPSNDTTTKISLTQAIRGLGYSKAEADRALLAISDDDLMKEPLEVLIKKTLNVLTGSKAL